ncbi:hypothetical protein F511_15310 [Dorcoceras hygrometricum]|uniref:F-box associated beta-propeller type 3 domain-containing protein n=1 Tax=Dorcoceras hygrometricum TaxID=472368 RepID=A0A2Z7C5Y5_9LAMI|nr:hypothetical protein F511_15310 [Dorcoceras hygrometricum]
MIRSPDFIHHHLRNSTGGVIIETGGIDHTGIYVEMRGGSLEIHEFDFGFRGLVWSSCNGLVLASEFKNYHTHSVVNPLTKQQVFLPPYSNDIGYHPHFALAFVEATMEYKVACMIDVSPLFARTHIAVLTVGVDKVWRYIDIKHLSLETRLAYFSVKPIVTGGYVHWISRTFVLTMNVETESFRLFPVPRTRPEHRMILPMGSSLSLVYGELSREVWEMNPRTGEWIKLLTFDLESHIFQDCFPHLCQMVPYGWLQVREVLLFIPTGFPRCSVAYNIKTREMQPFELDPVGPLALQYHVFAPHVNSLVRLEG